MPYVWKSQNTNNQESASAGNLQSQAYSSKAVHMGIFTAVLSTDVYQKVDLDLWPVTLTRTLTLTLTFDLDLQIQGNSDVKTRFQAFDLRTWPSITT